MVPAPIPGYLFGLPNWHSTVPQCPLLRPCDGGNIAYALGRNRQCRFVARHSQRQRRWRAAVSSIRQVFIEVFHTPCWSALRTGANPPNTASCCTMSCVTEDGRYIGDRGTQHHCLAGLLCHLAGLVHSGAMNCCTIEGSPSVPRSVRRVPISIGRRYGTL
jgi:hypothetical protein